MERYQFSFAIDLGTRFVREAFESTGIDRGVAVEEDAEDGG